MSRPRTIWKFPIPLKSHKKDRITITLGHYHKVVLVALDPETQEVAVWIEHYPEADQTRCWTFFIVGTGHFNPNDTSDHVGSVVDGSFIWHVYRQETLP